MASFVSRYLNELVKFKRKIEGAFRMRMDKDLLQLFDDYFSALSDPEMQELSEKKIIAFEKDRGIDMHFTVSAPGYTVKALVAFEKYFVNVCMTEFVAKATSKIRDGKVVWDIPVHVSKLRDDKDFSGRRCNVIDAFIHPETMKIAECDRRFKKQVECEITTIMKEKLNADLTKVEWLYPKMKIKGKLPALIVFIGEGCHPDTCTRVATVDEYYKELANKIEQDYSIVVAEALG